jgi:hypothetical protein
MASAVSADACARPSISPRRLQQWLAEERQCT